MNHIFLTGEIQVGKTTIINKICSKYGSAAQGFKTIAVNAGDATLDSDEEYLFIIPFYINSPAYMDKPFAVRNRKKRKKTGYPEVFNEQGVAIIKDATENAETKLIIMDELGFFENEASIFQTEVMNCLASDIPVLGVIKPMSTEFLDKIRALPNITIIEVTVDNREKICALLQDVFDENLSV